MGKIILYHGTPDKFTKPILIKQTKTTDFGVGFYLTTYNQQAKDWGENGYYLRREIWIEVLSIDQQHKKWTEKYGYAPPKEILIFDKIPFEKYHGNEYYVKNFSLDLEIIKKIFKVKEFNKYDEEWFDFVAEYRNAKKLNCKPAHDITIGPLADGGELTKTLYMYEHNEITKEEALERIKFKKDNNQYCIHNEEILNHYLKFEGCDKFEHSNNI